MAVQIKRHVEKGLESKNKIYNTAKQTLRDFGYNGTKIKRIVDRAEVPLGLFSYYFKTKEHLLSSVYKDYYIRINALLETCGWFNAETSIFKHICSTKIYYDNIFADDACKRFYLEVLEKDLNLQFFFDIIYKRYETFYTDYKIAMDIKDLKSIILFDFGARRQFLMEYQNGNIDMNENDMIRHMSSITPLLMRIDYSEIERMFDKCDECVSKLECGYIKII